MTEDILEFDAIVIGTGFAGAVSACRLVQAGQKICVLERGRRYQPDDFPDFPRQTPVENATEEADLSGFTPSPDFDRWFWNIGDGQGLWEMRDLGGVVSAQAAGYGGGSLIYASVHLRTPGDVFKQTDTATGKSLWPQPYRRGDDGLDPYYDLAAYMLDIKPADPGLDLAKQQQMKRAARKLKECYEDTSPSHDSGFQYISLPLAISHYRSPGTVGDSDRTQENIWGRGQKSCDLRGYCWMGCSRQAKNTLDLNYLAIAEDKVDSTSQEDPQPPLADIRTMAEVSKVRHSDKEGWYEVTYLDHLVNRKEVTVRAPYVFLCAGAVNTTELLLRNSKHMLAEDEKGRSVADEEGWLQVNAMPGTRYFPNADSLATIKDCDQTQNAHIGPTITSSLLYDDGNDWFLVQDGGFPADLEPLIGFFSSPLWIRRNRFLESNPTKEGTRYSRERVEHHRSLKKTRPNTLMELPFGTITESIRKLPGGSAQVVPKQLREALENDREEILDQIGNLSEERIRQLFDELSRMMDQRLENLADALPESYRDKLDDITEFGVSRGMLRLIAQVIWGSEADMARYVAAQLVDEAPGDRAGLVRSLTSLMSWALNYRASNDRLALLLTMGRDQLPGELYLHSREKVKDPPGGILQARLPGPLEDTARITQERMLRDIASVAWDGELRTNPVWNFMRRRFTVHSQGGCTMGEAGQGVTDADGEVRGCKGLYVMDAAAFPTSVGVNPSATIAAVAEYKIENFIRKNIEGHEDWEADLEGKVDTWLAEVPYDDGRTHAAMLDPLPDRPNVKPGSAPVSKAVGLRFSETMDGFHDGYLGEQGEASGLWGLEDLDFTRKDIVTNKAWQPEKLAEDCTKASSSGIGEQSSIEVCLSVTVRDLMCFLESYAQVSNEYGNRNKNHYGDDSIIRQSQIPVSGSLHIQRFLSKKLKKYTVKDGSYLWLFPNATRGQEVNRSMMRYRLLFDAPGPGGTEEYVLNGVKILDDSIGFDLWEDTATLFFEIQRSSGGPKLLSGVLRLHADQFLLGQVQSMEATGTSDPARQSWALAAFGRFFSGHLAKLYVPEMDQFQNVLKNILSRTHG